MKLFKQHISARRFLTARQIRKFTLSVFRLLLATLFIVLFLTAPLVNAKSTPTIKLIQSAEQVWQRQQVLITLTVTTDDPFARLEFDSFSHEGFSINPFELQRIESDKQTTLTLKWAVFPFVAGKHALKLPRVRYRPNRGRIQTLALKTLALNVRRLPLYVSPTMPVGKVSLASNWDEGWLVTTDSLLGWQIILEGKGVAKQFMPPLSRRLDSTDAVEILPLHKSDITLKTVTGITHERQYNIPLKIHDNGFANLPEIAIQYFEPTAGKLEKAHLSLPFVIAINKGLLGFVILLSVALFSVFLFMLGTKIKYILRSKKKQRQAIQALSQATNCKQIRTALNQYTLAKGWGDNLALDELPKLEAQDRRNLVKNALLEKTINKLQAQQFSQQSGDGEIVEIKKALIRCLRNL